MEAIATPPPAIANPLEEPGAQASAGHAQTRVEIPIAIPSTQRCQPQTGGEIVVCATDPEAYRLRPLPPGAEPAPDKAEIKLGEAATAGIAAEAGGVGGWPSNRVMVTVKLPF